VDHVRRYSPFPARDLAIDSAGSIRAGSGVLVIRDIDKALILTPEDRNIRLSLPMAAIGQVRFPGLSASAVTSSIWSAREQRYWYASA
jgi:hypothetical protein